MSLLNRTYFITFFLIVSLLISQPKSIQMEPISRYSKTAINQPVKQLINNYNKSLTYIIDNYIQNIEHDDYGGIKWNKYTRSYNESRSKYYYGFYYGTAGIGKVFLDFYSYYNIDRYLNIASRAADYIYRNGITEGPKYDTYFNQTGYIFWNRSEDSGSVYSGIKYGNTGIADFFLDLYVISHNKTYLNWAEQSLQTLMTQTIVPMDGSTGYYWGYPLFGSTPIADIQYGVAGMADVFLKIYHISSNETYLLYGKQGLKWILSESDLDKNTTEGQRFVRYSPDPSYPVAFTGYLTGNAGIGTVLLEYFNSTNNQDYLLIAEQLANWLLATEKNGLWERGGADLLTDTDYNEGTYYGFGAGSAGIGLFFLKLYEITDNVKYLRAVKRIEDSLNNNMQFKDDSVYWTIQKTGTWQETISTDIKLGISGIGLLYSKIYALFGLNTSLNALNGIDNYFNSLKLQYGYIPTIVNSSTEESMKATNYDLSWMDGLGGIAAFYLSSLKSLKETKSIYNSKIYSELSGHKDTFPISGFLLGTLLMVIGIISFKRKFHQQEK